MDPVLLEVYRHRFAGIAEEMGVALQRTAFSPNIKERLDFSCALFDGEGKLIAQAAHIPVHLGAMPASVFAALEAFKTWHPGDVVLLNDPYCGGTHLPDITMITPVFYQQKGAPVFFIASRAHHADVGGMAPGSLPLSTELFQEGIIIPPVKLYERNVLNEALKALILRNVRTPVERDGDLAAQRAAHAVGNERINSLVARYGLNEVLDYANHLRAYSEKIVRKKITAWPDGTYSGQDFLEIAGAGAEAGMISLELTIEGDTATFDFSGTAQSMDNSLNAVLSITKSACYYTVASLIEEDVPVNAGCFAPIKVYAEPGSIVHALPPAAVAGGNVETSQRIVDVALRAFARVLPDKVPAASQGTMNNLTIGGIGREGKPFAYYETIGGGMGASSTSDGLDGVHVHMSNTLNTPVEALEMAFPFRITHYGLRDGSGGNGKYQGGKGIVREYELHKAATITVLSERRLVAPSGAQGGEDGGVGKNTLIEQDGSEVKLPGKFSRKFEEGERIRIETPGGGGYGLPEGES